MDNILNQTLVEKFCEAHKTQLVNNGIPEIYWPALCTKLVNEMFDAGDYFQILQIVDENDCVTGNKVICWKENGIKLNDPMGIFLIDHAWTCRVNECKEHLTQIDGLLNRMCNLMNISVERDEDQSDEEHKNALIDEVLTNMWKYNQTYSLKFDQMTDEEREPRWYIMDEFGSSIRHGDTATVKCMPFYYLPSGTMFTILWPIKELNHSDEVTRDYTNGVKDSLLKRAKLVPWYDWYDTDCTDIDSNQVEPDEEYFNHAREDEILPDKMNFDLFDQSKDKSNDGKTYKVFTDLDMIKDFLTDKKFTIVEDQSQADIIFIRKHFKDYKSLSVKNPTCMINQFPFENVVTVKDLLAIVCRRVPDATKWLPVTYNLHYELPKFVSYYQKRENENLDNHWIVKPWNLARSIDTYVTKNLNQIIRLQESGPKIACKYITNPVLFYREELGGKVKFDVRYIVLLRSVNPLTIYTYNVFWLRFANKPYSLDNLDDYEKHFTVMNYKPVNLKQINCEEFVPMFETQYPKFKWDGVQEKIFKMIRQVFEGATMKEPPKGFSNNPQSRAMYAIDLMLDWRETTNNNNETTTTIEPMVCEINFMPDCTRACKYHPSFFNDVFYTLFLDSTNDRNVTKIC